MVVTEPSKFLTPSNSCEPTQMMCCQLCLYYCGFNPSHKHIRTHTSTGVNDPKVHESQMSFRAVVMATQSHRSLRVQGSTSCKEDCWASLRQRGPGTISGHQAGHTSCQHGSFAGERIATVTVLFHFHPLVEVSPFICSGYICLWSPRLVLQVPNQEFGNSLGGVQSSVSRAPVGSSLGRSPAPGGGSRPLRVQTMRLRLRSG